MTRGSAAMELDALIDDLAETDEERKLMGRAAGLLAYWITTFSAATVCSGQLRHCLNKEFRTTHLTQLKATSRRSALT